MDNYSEALEQLAEVLRKQNEIYDVSKLASASMSLAQTSEAMRNVVVMSNIDPALAGFAASQAEYMDHVSVAALTPAIKTFQQSLAAVDMSGINGFLKGFSDKWNSSIVSAAEMSLVKLYPSNLTIDVPRGMKSALKQMHVNTAELLSKEVDIKYDAEEKKYFLEQEQECSTDVGCLNVLSSSVDLFDELSVSDLLRFENELYENPSFANDTKTGKRIFQIIESWNDFISFDQDILYHARVLDEERFFLNDEMTKAPVGISGHGRFNHAGRAHYYCTSTLDGALAEIKKHHKGKRVQYAKIRPAKEVKMIDLSQRKEGSEFLKHLRLPINDEYGVMKKEYLLPCFVADCCKRIGVDGIKYYGSAKYNNYVTWKDDFYEFVDGDVLEI